MQFTNLLTILLSTLLTLSPSALASVIPIPSNTTATPGPQVGRPYCTPTGPGVCNLGMSWWYGFGSSQHDDIYVYDRYCREIGSTHGLDMGSFEIYSELPYVVVGTMNPTARFMYAGGSYGDHCSYYSDGVAHVKQCAFNC